MILNQDKGGMFAYRIRTLISVRLQKLRFHLVVSPRDFCGLRIKLNAKVFSFPETQTETKLLTGIGHFVNSFQCHIFFMSAFFFSSAVQIEVQTTLKEEGRRTQ